MDNKAKIYFFGFWIKINYLCFQDKLDCQCLLCRAMKALLTQRSANIATDSVPVHRGTLLGGAHSCFDK